MLSASSQLSLRTALDSVLTWTSLKCSKTPAQERPLARNKDIFSVVVTPDRIPQFFIPSLEVEHFFVQVSNRERGQSDCASPELPVPCCTPPNRNTPESCSARRGLPARRETLCKKASFQSFDGSFFPLELERAADHSDPATRAALSLPHLAKITTPYGFLALGESPNIRRKESLFFEQDPQDIRMLLSHRKKSYSLSRSRSSPVGGSKEQQPPAEQEEPLAHCIRCTRSVSWDVICKATSTSQAPTPTATPTPTPTPTSKPAKKRFQGLIKKHISSIKRMRSSGFSAEKTRVPFKRAQSQPVL